MPELRHLRYFLAVAEELNFTRASERLHIGQPALSATVQQLEAELGVELLRRSTRQVELSPAGRVLRERGEDLLAGTDALWDAIRRVGDGTEGTVHLAYTVSVAFETAPHLIERVLSKLPGLQFSAEVLSSGAVVDAVSVGKADVGLVRGAEPPASVGPTLIRRERQGVLLASDHPLAARAELPIEALREQTLLIHERDANPAHYDALVMLCHTAGFEPRLSIRTVPFDPANISIRDGRAVAIVGESSRPVAGEGLSWISLPEKTPKMEVWLLHSANAAPAARRFAAEALIRAHEEGWLSAEPP